MGDGELRKFFEDYTARDGVFVERKALQTNYLPDSLPHREEQIKQIANILAPSLRRGRPSNLFVYGKTGTGKTHTTNHVVDNLITAAKEGNIPLKNIYVNCKLKRLADTEYRLIAQLIREMGGSIAATGLPTDEVYKTFFEIVDKQKALVLLVLDEIDQLVKKAGDEILYNLVRVNEELKQSQIVLLGISNDLVFVDTLDPRVRSSLSEEEIVFPPYNAFQLQDILRKRSEVAFKSGVVRQGVIEKCAAYAAREHGDARRALELMRVSAELAERGDSDEVKLEHIDQAEEKIERDRVIDVIKSQPKQSQATLYSILLSTKKEKQIISTGEVYNAYKTISSQVGLRPLTQRRISDIISELDMLGIISTKIISKGRYGRTSEISLAIPPPIFDRTEQLLAEGLALS
ncbi:cell division control protein Cdc6 [Candidatus Woesearchaeota archaeon]|nr:cell division control protein Cdc6 [Candidatus Woesearchaeota archaeon]